MKLSWHERVSLSANDGEVVVSGPRSRLALRRLSAEVVDAMRRLTPPGEDADLLSETVMTSGGSGSLAHWLYCLEELDQRGLVRKTLFAGDRPLATVVPLGRPVTVPNGRATSHGLHTRYHLSRFAYLRRDEDQMVLESPLAHAKIVMHDARGVALVAALAAKSSLADLEHLELLPSDALRRLVALLAETQIIDRADEDPNRTDSSPLDTWEFHDLLFHSRSRRGRSDAPFGATFRFAQRPPPPAIKSVVGPPLRQPSPGGSGRSDALFRPDLRQLERDDPPLALVQERRRSVREYATQPVTDRQLGEFLYRVARVKERRQVQMPTASGNVAVELATRPYPAGGALYELEFYVAVRNCRGLESGLHYYDPLEHRLLAMDADRRATHALLDEAAASAGIEPATVQVLIVLAARFERLAWKYQSIAYALTLKHVGVVYQTMYLAATAMGLAPCALGCGDSEVFARASGNAYCTETSVGEFLLGSRAS
ncbi:MAG TPA: SagB family peptide dehydrogenase [Pirellulales bacterium]|nr:SagB family peptide dehydrogenase [Pirellulales bacterium]